MTNTKIFGALVVLPPGKGPGACAEPCKHAACAEARSFASMTCMVCGKPNGYGVPVYVYAGRHGHAECVEAAHARAVDALLADLVAIIVAQCRADAAATGRSAEGRAENPCEPATVGVPATAPRPDCAPGLHATAFSLPEIDIQVRIPLTVRRHPTKPKRKKKEE